MQIKITGLADFGLDGEYDLDPQPNTRELTRFRKELGIGPADLTEILVAGSLEVLPLYVYTALQREGRSDLASKVLDVPTDLWRGADLKGADVDDPAAEQDAEKEEAEQLPPT